MRETLRQQRTDEAVGTEALRCCYTSGVGTRGVRCERVESSF